MTGYKNGREKKPTMRDRASQDTPAFVRGKDATPAALGDDDLAWAMARRLSEKLYASGIASGKSDAWFYYRFKSGLDRAKLRARYSEEPFTDGKAKVIPLPEFGRRIVSYFWDNYPWPYENSPEAAIGMVTDPAIIDEVTRLLKKRYANQRLLLNNRKLTRRELGNTDSRA